MWTVRKSWMAWAACALSACLLNAADAPRSPHAPEPEEGEIPPDAALFTKTKSAVPVPAEVVALPDSPAKAKPAKSNTAASTTPSTAVKPATTQTSAQSARPAPAPVAASSARPAGARNAVLPNPLPPLQSPTERAREAGYGVVLSGVLEKHTEIGPEQSPAMVRGLLVIPEGVTLTLKPGAVVHLVADPTARKPATPGEPDPTQSAAIWVWGTLNASGHTGDPVELSSFDATPAPLLFYGGASSTLVGVRVRNCAVVQNAGIVRWTNTEFLSTPHVALAGGAALFTHCSFRNCGGIFATYQAGTWSLLVRRSVFASCREGIVLASDPGEARLVIEKNHFLNTRGAHIRAMNLPGATARDVEFFIGENWYGTPQADEVDLRIADRRLDSRVKARLNIRPPSAQPYANIGGGVSADVLADSEKEQVAAAQKLIAAHGAKPAARPASAGSSAEKGAGKSGEAASMNRTIRRPRTTPEPGK